MRIFRYSFIFLFLLVGAVFLSSCSAKKDVAKNESAETSNSFTGKFEPESSSSVTNNLKNELNLINMIKLEKEDISVHYGFNIDFLDDFSAYASKTEGCADELAVFKITDSGERQVAIDAIMEKIRLKSQSYKELNTKEYAKFGANSVSLHGNYIVVLICASPDNAYNLLNKFYV